MDSPMSRVRYTRVKDIGTKSFSSAKLSENPELLPSRNQKIIDIAIPLPDNKSLPARAMYWFVTTDEVTVLFNDTKLFVWNERIDVVTQEQHFYLNQIDFKRDKQGLIALQFPDGDIETITCLSTKTNKRRKLGHAPEVIGSESQSAHYNNNRSDAYESTVETLSNVDIQQPPQSFQNCERQLSSNEPLIINTLLLLPNSAYYMQAAETALFESGFIKEASSQNQLRLYSHTKANNKKRHYLLFPYGINLDGYLQIEDCLRACSEVILLLENEEQNTQLMAVLKVTNVNYTQHNWQFVVKTSTIPTADISYQTLSQSAQHLFAINELQTILLGGLSCKNQANLLPFLFEWNLGLTIKRVVQNVYICFTYEPTNVKAFTEYAEITLKAFGINTITDELLVVHGSVLVYMRCPSYVLWHIQLRAEDVFHSLSEEGLKEIYECGIEDINTSLEHSKNKKFITELTHLKEQMISDQVSLQRGVRIKGALDNLNRAHSIDNALTLIHQGATKLSLDDYQGALIDLNRADEIEPNNAFTLRYRGITKQMLGDYEGALKDLNRADEIQPNDSLTLSQRGITKQMLGDYKGALEDLNRADEIEPNDAFTLSVRGDTKRMLRDYEGALNDLNRADEIQPNNAFTLSVRGDTKQMLDNYQGALEDLNRADALKPKDKNILYHSFQGVIQAPFRELTVIKLIGEGGFGEVLLAEWHGIKVALKKMKSTVIVDDMAHEAKSLMLFRYKFIVLLMGITTDPETKSTILIMEYMKHGSLEDLLFKQNVTLTRSEAIRLALDIAQGVNYLHSQNPKVLHRNLKSANVLLYRNKTRAKIADFGTVRFLHPNVQAKTMIGNPVTAMPPEMLAEEVYDEKVDVFSFGVVLYEMLTNKRMPQLEEKHRIKRIQANINDAELMRLVLECCASEPLKRPHMHDIVGLLRKMKDETK